MDSPLLEAQRAAERWAARDSGSPRAEVEFCYTDGDLAKALREAADFVAWLRDGKLIGVIANVDEKSGWMVQVIYRR